MLAERADSVQRNASDQRSLGAVFARNFHPLRILLGNSCPMSDALGGESMTEQRPLRCASAMSRCASTSGSVSLLVVCAPARKPAVRVPRRGLEPQRRRFALLLSTSEWPVVLAI